MVAYGVARFTLLVASLAATTLPLSPAWSAWNADVSKDATGRLKVQLTADIDDSRLIYLTCDSSRSAVLALVVPATEPRLNTAGMMLSFAFADGSRWVSRSALYRYDNDQVAVGYGSPADVQAIVQAFATTRDAVQVGLAPPGGTERTFSADVRGSAAAAKKVLDNCFPTN
jgi:hypothetical protein